MKTKHHQLVVIGAGPAGLAAAIEAGKNGIGDILIIEREKMMGGILPQCIHPGFGLHIFKEELTGPEYAQRFIDQMLKDEIGYAADTTVLDLTPGRQLTTVNDRDGLCLIQADAVILAMGCRERPRGTIGIPGTRPAGIFTAGTAQRFVNIEGYMPGKKAVILGSGDIGLIMARRLTLEGAKVEMVCELMPWAGGLARNIVQCLDDFGIPLLLEHTITRIQGQKRLEGVTITDLKKNRSFEISCDTLLLSAGLIPENELTKKAGIIIDPLTGGARVDNRMQTSVEGIFSCGNVLHVNDLADNVTEESRLAGKYAADHIKGSKKPDKCISVIPGDGVRYAVPQILYTQDLDEDKKLFFRVNSIMRDAKIVVKSKGRILGTYNRKIMTPGEMEKITLGKNVSGAIDEVLEIGVEKK